MHRLVVPFACSLSLVAGAVGCGGSSDGGGAGTVTASDGSQVANPLHAAGVKFICGNDNKQYQSQLGGGMTLLRCRNIYADPTTNSGMYVPVGLKVAGCDPKMACPAEGSFGACIAVDNPTGGITAEFVLYQKPSAKPCPSSQFYLATYTRP